MDKQLSYNDIALKPKKCIVGSRKLCTDPIHLIITTDY